MLNAKMTLYKKHINDPLAAIYNEKHWRLNTISPLYGLESSTVKLKQYASIIRQAIVNTVRAKSNIKFIVLFEVIPYLKHSEDDSDALTITVSSSRDNHISKLVYNAILLSWGISSKVKDAVHLPYMLERGEQRIGTAVKSTLQTMFDCNIKQISFTQHQLLQLGFNFVENDTSCSTDSIIFCYRTKEDHKNKLTLTFDIGDVLIIWNGTKNEMSKTTERVSFAYQALQNQTFYTVELDVTSLDLCEINLSKAEVKSNGVIKMKTPELVNCVFTVLNDISNLSEARNDGLSELYCLKS